MKWYDRAKQRMAELDITQTDLIKPLGKNTRGAIGHYLTGRREPSTQQLITLGIKLNCSIDWLLTGNPEFAPYGQRIRSDDMDEIKKNQTAYMLPSKIIELKTLLRIGVSDDTLTQDYIPQLLKLMEQLTKTLMILTAKVEEKKLDGRDG